MSGKTFDERSVDQNLYILLDIGAKLGIWILDNSIYQITVSYKILQFNLFWSLQKAIGKTKPEENEMQKIENKEYHLSTDGYKTPFEISSSAMYEARL